MKRIELTFFNVIMAITLLIAITSCVENLLDQTPAGEPSRDIFWKSEGDAVYAINGAYSSIRPFFSYEYDFDGMTEIAWTRGPGAANGIINNAFSPSASGFATLWTGLYGGINRANYVIDGVKNMLVQAKESSVPGLERVLGEARFLRGLCYFRLISMWGDVPYLYKTVQDKSEVERLSRLPIGQIKDSILADFSYAYEKLPAQLTASEIGRASKIAALAFRGKVELYWASWNKFGWPELEGFTPEASEADAAYTAAATDFHKIINSYGLDLFRGGDPGLPGSPGKCDVLPNYFYLFTPDFDNPVVNPEIIFAFAYSGPNIGQGSKLMNDLGNRQTENSQSYVCPTLDLADCYQLIATGDFAPPLVPMSGNSAGARQALNSAVNPASYEGRDYRARSTILWDYESMVKLESLQEKGTATWLYKSSAPYIQASAMETGYVPRKWIRNKSLGCSRDDTPQDYYLMRLADVYLMYAEATNFLNGPQTDAIALVNRVRARGGLPALSTERTATADDFFRAIEQERKVELVMEGQRYFDIRRWRRFEDVWGAPGTGRSIRNTWNEIRRNDFLNYVQRSQERYYIMNIPESERDLNPNLTQNTPWL